MLSLEKIEKLSPNFKLELAKLLEDDELRWPILASYKIDRDLYVYAEDNILDKYDEPYLAGNHDRKHIDKVLANALILLEIEMTLYDDNKTYTYHKDQIKDMIEAEYIRDINILYAAVCLHDIGLNVNNTITLLSIYKIDNKEDRKLAKEIVEALNNDNKLARKYHQHSGYLLTKYFYRNVLQAFGFIDKE